MRCLVQRPRRYGLPDSLRPMPDDVIRSRAVKAVIPAAGMATRFLPATKAVPKELLPVVDRPVLQYIVEEAAAAGIRDILLVTGRGQDQHGRPLRPAAVPGVQARGEGRSWSGSPPSAGPAELAEIYTCRQGEPLGLGHAVSYAESHVGNEPFVVMLGDEFVSEDQPLLPAMLDLQAHTGGIVLAFLEVDWAETSRYGIASVSPAPDVRAAIGAHPGLGEVYRVTGLVEKPPAEKAPEQPCRGGPVRPAAADLRRDPADRAGRRGRDPADRRDGAAAGRGYTGARNRLPGRAL